MTGSHHIPARPAAATAAAFAYAFSYRAWRFS
jgi:hypothetical protein